LGEEVELGDVECDLARGNDGHGVEYVWNGSLIDNPASGTRRESIRLDTTALAADHASQRRRYRRTTAHVPGPPTAPINPHSAPAPLPIEPDGYGDLTNTLSRSGPTRPKS
jgi:hypothetical protein